jgi:hypothetical protein
VKADRALSRTWSAAIGAVISEKKRQFIAREKE